MEAFGTLVLDKGRRYFNLDDNLRSLKRKLQRLSSRKSDFEFQVINAERLGTKKRKREVEIWFEEVAMVQGEFGALTKSIQEGGFLENAISSGDTVAKMDAIIEDLVEQSKHFDGLLLETFESKGEPRVTTKLFGEMFDRGLKTIMAWLVIDRISSIGIYGMGGVGKTTLAKHIHNHLLVQTQFQVCWITVSQEFSIKKLQDGIAKCLRLDLSYESDEDSRAAILSRALVKQCVLILDDVWQEFSFEKVGIALGANKYKVILTTRSLALCDRIGCQRVFEAKTLATNEAWDLFSHTLGTKTMLHVHVEEIAKSIAKRCAGLPLGVITMAGSMRGVSNINEWKIALEQLNLCSIGHDEMERDVFPILEWSFNRLNECLRLCFLYCSLYPEDSKIKRKELIDLFIWAELIPKRNSRSEEFDKGYMILNKLIKVCLLEETTDLEGNECVRMHDLVRDMALRITNGNSKLKTSEGVPRFLVKSRGWRDPKTSTLEQQEWTEGLHAVSIILDANAKIEVPPGWSPNCPKLSTLLLPFLPTKRIPDSFFLRMFGLKVLDLSHSKLLEELPNSVSDMVNLTALILGYCISLRFVPPLGKLKQLRELDLSRTKIQNLPQGLESLINLERLNLGRCHCFIQKIIPIGTFSEFHRLQQLIFPPYGTLQVNDPKVLSQLEIFKGHLPFTDFCKIFEWPEYYDLYINDVLPEYTFHGDIECQGDTRECKQLLFHECNLGRGMNYPVLLLPGDIKCLILEECVGMGIRCLSDVFRNFASLKDLSCLKIMGLDGIEFLLQISSPAPCDQLVVPSFSPLLNLQELTLENLPNLVGLFHGGLEAYLLPPGTFSSLTRLWISRCYNMKKLFTVQLLQNLGNLEGLCVRGCKQLEEIAVDGSGLEQRRGGIQLNSSEATTTIVLPKLQWLELNNLPELKSICKAAMTCDSIRRIKIFGCLKLKRLPLFLPTINGLLSPPSTLYKIRGDAEWWESLEWDNLCAKNALDPFFSTKWWI